MQTTHNFNQFCEKYNYDFQDEINEFKENNNLDSLDTDDLEVRVYDQNDVTVSVHYFAGHDGGFKYTNTDGYVEVYEVMMPDEVNENHVRQIVKELT